ncbi:MAG: radical SAM protein [Bryobacteraceae bacterium]
MPDAPPTDSESLLELLRRLDVQKLSLLKSLTGPSTVPEIAAKALVRKIQNLCLARHHFLRRATSLLSRPLGLVVDPVNGCNLACPGCVHSRFSRDGKLFDWRPGRLPLDRFAQLLDRYGPYAFQAMFCNYGEPLVNPDTPRLVGMAKGYLMQTMFSTNLAVRGFDADAYVESGLDQMVVSIDGATQGVYELFRRRGDIEIAYRNLRLLIEAKRRAGKRTPVVCWHYLAFEHNEHEIPLAAETARQLGVDVFRVVTPFDVSWDDPSIKPSRAPPSVAEFNCDSEQDIAANWMVRCSESAASAIDREFERAWEDQYAGEEQHHAPATCQWLYTNMALDANGRVFPCWGAARPDLDLTYAHLDDPDPFHAPKYNLARLSWAHRDAYRQRHAELGGGAEPHCANCDWPHDEVAIGPAQISHYLRAARERLASAALSDPLIGWLTSW